MLPPFLRRLWRWEYLESNMPADAIAARLRQAIVPYSQSSYLTTSAIITGEVENRRFHLRRNHPFPWASVKGEIVERDGRTIIECLTEPRDPAEPFWLMLLLLFMQAAWLMGLYGEIFIRHAFDGNSVCVGIVSELVIISLAVFGGRAYAGATERHAGYVLTFIQKTAEAERIQERPLTQA